MWKYLDDLRSWHLLALSAAVLIFDLVVPDPIPLLDEVLLGAMTLFLARWKKRGR